MAANCLNCQCWSFVHGHRKISLGARGISCTGAPSVNKHTHAVTCLCHRMIPYAICPSSHESQVCRSGREMEANWSKICHGQAPLDFARARGTKCLSDLSLAAYAIYLLLSASLCPPRHFLYFIILHLLLYFIFLLCDHLRHGSLEVDSLAARDRWQIPWRQTWKLSLVPLRVARGKWKKMKKDKKKKSDFRYFSIKCETHGWPHRRTSSLRTLAYFDDLNPSAWWISKIVSASRVMGAWGDSGHFCLKFECLDMFELEN